MNFRHGTVFRTHVSVSGSMSSTMTKGASSSVTMLRWLSSGSQSEKDLYLGHTACLRLRVWFSHLPTWYKEKDTPVLSGTTGFQKGESSPVRGMGEEPHHLQGFSATYLNVHFCLYAKKDEDKGKAEYWAAPMPWTLPRLINMGVVTKH